MIVLCRIRFRLMILLVGVGLSMAPQLMAQTAIPEYDATTSPLYGSSIPHDDEGLRSERPLRTIRLTTVGTRRFMVESGFDYQLESNGSPNQHQFTFPTLLRYGVLENLEFRAHGDMLTLRNLSGKGGDTTGFGDLFFGTKWSIVEGGGLLPNLGVIGELGLPTGSNNVSGNTLLPSGAAILNWTLPQAYELNINLGLDSPAKDSVGDRFVRMTYGVAIGKNLPVLAERLRAYLEFSGAAPFKGGKAGNHQFGTGATFSLNHHISFDTFFRIGINDASPNFETGTGVSWRL